jgi:hypothetical protein
MTVHLTAQKDCRVYVWVLDNEGRVREQLFPNDDDQDNHLTAGKERVVPGNNGYVLETEATKGPGVERLRVLATTGDAPVFPAGTKVGRFSVYSGQDSERLASAVRGIVN